MSDLSAIEAELQYRLAFETIVSRWSTRLIAASAPEVPELMQRALGELGDFQGADRCFLAHIEDERWARCIEWHRSGVDSGGFTTLDLHHVPWFHDQARNCAVVEIRDVQILPDAAENEREQLIERGVQSALYVPLRDRGHLIGYFALHWVGRSGAWSGTQVGQLRIAAEMCLNVMVRSEREQELNHSEQRFRDVAAAVSERVWETDTEFRFVYMSDQQDVPRALRASQVLGKTPWEILGCDPEEDPHWGALVSRLGKHEPFSDFKTLSRRPDGSLRHIRIDGVPYFNDQGQFAGYRGVHLDETDERERAIALAASERTYRTLFENVLDGVLRLDPQGNVQSVNPSFLHMLGRPMDEMAPEERKLGEPVQLSRHIDVEVLQSLLERVHVENELRNIAIEIVRYDGKTLTGQISLHGVHGANGDLLYVDCTVVDVSERIKAESQLRASDERFRALAAATFDGVAIIAGMKVIDASEQLAQMLAYPRAELTGKRMADLLTPESYSIVVADPAHDRADPLELQCVRKDGDSFPAELRWRSVDYRGQGVRVAVISDLSLARQSERALLDGQRRLRALAAELATAEERARRATAADVHDGIAQILAVAKIRQDALAARLVSPADKQEAEAISALIAEAISMTRVIMTELVPPLLYDFGIGAAIKWLAMRMRDEGGLNFTLSGGEEELPLEPEAAVILYRSVRELLMNVIQHSQTTSAAIRIRRLTDSAVIPDPLAEDRATRDTLPQSAETAGTVEIVVEDRGVGFDPTRLERLPIDTHGFGLFNIRERILAIGGQVELQAAEGSGTRVVLRAPLAG